MKKTILFLLNVILAATFLLSGCGGKKTDYSKSEYLGVWSAASCEYGGMQLDVNSQIGTFKFTLMGDGTVNLVTDDGSFDGNWDEANDGIIIDEDDDMHFIAKGDRLFLDYNDVIIYFSR